MLFGSHHFKRMAYIFDPLNVTRAAFLNYADSLQDDACNESFQCSQAVLKGNSHIWDTQGSNRRQTQLKFQCASLLGFDYYNLFMRYKRCTQQDNGDELSVFF